MLLAFFEAPMAVATLLHHDGGKFFHNFRMEGVGGLVVGAVRKTNLLRGDKEVDEVDRGGRDVDLIFVSSFGDKDFTESSSIVTMPVPETSEV